MKICPLCHQTYSDTRQHCPRDKSALKFITITDGIFTSGYIIDDKYRLVEFLGSGAFSEVWKCEEVATGATKSIKLLKFFSNDTDEIRDAVSRFFREADSASRLGHENIVRVEYFGNDIHGQAFLVMEYLQGNNLSQFIKPDGLSTAEITTVLPLLLEVTRGMEAAHKKGILHRDLKPDNIFVTTHGGQTHAKILDFGVAKILHDEKLAEISKDYMFGTPSYMSPEQVKGMELDGRTDIYSLGIIMFELFTGQLPFSGKTAQVLLQHIRNPPPNPPSLNENIDRDLAAIILKAMAKHLDHRYQTMAELEQDLTDYGASL
ncbi:serine/threonine protein kinase [Myxococcota bacterium]|nr:serine/threonine protein kinase [Myxococcota bacterium]